MNRSDMLVRLLEVLDRRTNYVEEIYDENAIRDVFFPSLENLSYVEIVETLKFQAPFVWGDGVMTHSNWFWSMGGRWS